MTAMFGWIRWIGLAACAMLMTSCDLSEHIDRSRGHEDEVVISVPEAAQTDAPAESLPEPVQAKLDLIKETLEKNSIRALVRLAAEEDSFRSNYGAISDYDHWYILKRAGIDPIEKTQQILEQPYGVKDFGAVKYYIWPELASRPPEDLEYSRLSFKERATLLELVGEAGLKQMQNGDPYPGFKLAIREDGSWAYLLQEY